MKMHLCKENPCPLQDKEYAEILKLGFSTQYTKEDIVKISVEMDVSEVKKWVGSEGTC